MRICLNTATIRERTRDLAEAVAITATAGYDAIEPWASEIDAWVDRGGSLPELRSRIIDAGLSVPNIIAFPRWCTTDARTRAAGLEEVARCARMAAALDCPLLAVPPAGLRAGDPLPWTEMVACYRQAYDSAAQHGVVAMLEFWGKAPQLNRLGESLAVVAESDRPQACLLPDLFHMYVGGSPVNALRHCGPGTIGLMHVNDWPADLQPARCSDADRILPGTGAVEWSSIIDHLEAIGYDGVLSLELFNRELWQDDPAAVARRGRMALQTILGRNA